jgi:radical SAM protein with 4Fe4S-binding SPASM domain
MLEISKKTIELELTHTCNYKCVHCYLPEQFKSKKDFLGLSFINGIFGQMDALGIKNILITGGEPLLHPDFKEIYTLAYNRGYVITLLTNARLIDDSVLKLLESKPPALIKVSLFGGTPESYQEITRKDAFHEVYDKILQLHRCNLRISVKLPLLKQNIDDIKDAQVRLSEQGITSKSEMRIIPLCNEDKRNLEYRLSPEKISSLSINTLKNKLAFRRINNSHPVATFERYRHTLRHCLEKCQPFLINPEGKLVMCYFLRDFAVDLHDHSLEEAIQILIKSYEENFDIDYMSGICESCKFLSVCKYCPGWARNESGKAGDPILFLCELMEIFASKYQLS